jgi:hypothetical protein
MSETLLGHLSKKFGTHPENWATEALGYILRRSFHARETVRALLAEMGLDTPASLTYRNQAVGHDDEGQPDLVGYDEDGRQRLVIEAKFGAGLTKHQPITYLRRLEHEGDVLLFVVPGRRLPYVWAELLRRCCAGELDPREDDGSFAGAKVATIGNGRKLATVTWRALLSPVALRLDAVEDRATREDVAQLLGLCDQQDADLFLPVTDDELTTTLFRRVVEFGEIAEAVIEVVEASGIADRIRVGKARGNGFYGRYVSLRGVGALFACDVRKWMKYAATPLWLSVYGPEWGHNKTREVRAVRSALAALESLSPPQLFIASDGFPTVPIFVPAGLERDDIVVSAATQIERVTKLLGSLGGKSGALPGSPPPDVGDAE